MKSLIILRYVEQVCAFVNLLRTKAGKGVKAVTKEKNCFKGEAKSERFLTSNLPEDEHQEVIFPSNQKSGRVNIYKPQFYETPRFCLSNQKPL